MSDLPEARLSQLEEFAGILFPFVRIWGEWVAIYNAWAEYYGERAQALELAGTDPARALEYRRRQKEKAMWGGSVYETVAPLQAAADLVAVALGGTFVKGVFRLTAKAGSPE